MNILGLISQLIGIKTLRLTYLNIAREVCVLEVIKLEITKNYCAMRGEG